MKRLETDPDMMRRETDKPRLAARNRKRREAERPRNEKRETELLRKKSYGQGRPTFLGTGTDRPREEVTINIPRQETTRVIDKK